MYTARESGWLGPSRYIQAYPKISTKPSLRTRLIAWRRFFTYVLILLLAPIIVIYIVNLYASSLAVPTSKMSGIERGGLTIKQSGPQVSGASTLAATALPASGSEPDSGLKQLLNDWAAKHPDQKWSVTVRGIRQDNRQAKLNAADSYAIGTAEGLANHLERLYLGKNVFSEERDRLLAKMNEDVGNRRGLMGCGQCRIFYESGRNDTIRYAQSIVDYPRGPYVLSILTDGGSESQIQQLATEVHLYLARQ